MTPTERIRRVVSRAYRLAIAPRTAFAMLMAWALLLGVWVVPFTVAGQTEETVGAIATGWLPLRVLYALLVVATIACTVARLIRDIRKVRIVRVPARARALEGESLPAVKTVASLGETLGSNGFTVFGEESTLYAVKGRYRVLWGSVFHLALILFVAAVWVFSVTLHKGGMELIVGQSATEFFTTTTDRPENQAFKPLLGDFRLTSVTPRFYKSYLLFERLDATATWRGENREFSLARPLWLSPVVYVSIQDFNYAPRVVVKSASGNTIDDSISALELFPPGSQDTLDMPPAKIRLILQVYPDHAVIGGRDGSRSYNLSDPRIQVTVFEAVGGVSQQRILARRTVALGEPIELPDRSTVTITEIRNVGTFRMVSAPWMPAVAASALLLFISLGGRLMWPRIDVIARETTGGVVVDARIDSLGRSAGREYVYRLFGDDGNATR